VIDAVLSYHTNPYTCGVAKFNHRLARELGVPLYGFGTGRNLQHPLVSLKFAELGSGSPVLPVGTYSVFLHDAFRNQHDVFFIEDARAVYAANAVIADDIRKHRPDVITAWCPSTVDGDASRGDIHVLTFGMAHKLALPYYEKLKSLLDDTPGTYTVGLSCAVHEGNPWDKAMHDAEDSLRRLFGLHLRVLGYLADDALVREMDQATAVAAFYDPALRSNNTSAWAVLDRGRWLITNKDERSPSIGTDVNAMSSFTNHPLAKLSDGGDICFVSAQASWSDLVKSMGVLCAK
jgi:hypothetical protein